MTVRDALLLLAKDAAARTDMWPLVMTYGRSIARIDAELLNQRKTPPEEGGPCRS